MGNSGADSNTRRVFLSRHRPARDWPFVCDNGRSWREFTWHVPTVTAVLFRSGLHQFLPVVDKVAVVGSEIMARADSRDHPPSPTGLRTRLRGVERLQRTSRSRLQRNSH